MNVKVIKVNKFKKPVTHTLTNKKCVITAVYAHPDGSHRYNTCGITKSDAKNDVIVGQFHIKETPLKELRIPVGLFDMVLKHIGIKSHFRVMLVEVNEDGCVMLHVVPCNKKGIVTAKVDDFTRLNIVEFTDEKGKPIQFDLNVTAPVPENTGRSCITAAHTKHPML